MPPEGLGGKNLSCSFPSPLPLQIILQSYDKIEYLFLNIINMLHILFYIYYKYIYTYRVYMNRNTNINTHTNRVFVLKASMV